MSDENKSTEQNSLTGSIKQAPQAPIDTNEVSKMIQKMHDDMLAKQKNFLSEMDGVIKSLNKAKSDVLGVNAMNNVSTASIQDLHTKFLQEIGRMEQNLNTRIQKAFEALSQKVQQVSNLKK